MRRLLAALLLLPAFALADVGGWSAGTIATTTTTSLSPGLPTNSVGDVLLCFSIARNTANAVSTSTTGWTQKIEGATSNVRYGIWWARQDGTITAPSFTRSSAGSLTRWVALCVTQNGVINSGDPFDVVGTVAEATASPITTASVTTGSDRSWVYNFVGAGVGTNSTPACSNESGATSVEITDQNGGSSTNRAAICIVRGSAALTPAGSTGTSSTTVTPTTTSFWSHVHFALKYQVPPTIIPVIIITN